MAFNPNEHLMKLKGKDYLEVRFRLVWFREDHPPETGWGIQTKCMTDDGTQAVFHATITDPEGRVVATGTKQESVKDFGDFREKAETGAVGRALGMLGYGTQFAPEFEEGTRIVDSPVEVKRESIGTPISPNLVDQANAVFPPGTVVDVDAQKKEETKPRGKDEVHPNKTKATEAITKTIAITASNKGVEPHKAATEHFKRPIESLYDIGNKPADYQPFLQYLNGLPNKGA